MENLYGGIILACTTTIFLLSQTLVSKISLYRNTNKKTIIKKLPENISTINRSINIQSMKEHLRICIETFIQELQNNSNFDLSNFYKNFSTDTIIERYIKKPMFEGQYKYDKNKIELCADDFIKYIYHELLHQASSLRNQENIQYVGFWQIVFRKNKTTKSNIGQGLNEGYTELLAKRYFIKYGHFKHPVYFPLVKIAQLIEVLIGQDLMESFYSKADLYSLINQLTQFEDLNFIVLLFKKIDKLYFELYESDNPIIQRNSKFTYKEILFMVSKLYIHAMYINNEKILEYYKEISETISTEIKGLKINQNDKEKLLQYMGEEYLSLKENRTKKFDRTL